jgi:hypothetical protein
MGQRVPLLVGARLAGGAAEAYRAFQLLEKLPFATAGRSEQGLPHATLAGVLNHKVALKGTPGISGGGDLSALFDAAKQTVGLAHFTLFCSQNTLNL